METKQTTKPDQSGEVILDEGNNAFNNTIVGNAFTGKREILKRVWTFFLQHPIAVITCVGILLGGIGTLFIGIDAIRPDSSNLSLNGEDIFKFIQAVKSEDFSQVEKFLQKVEENPKASDIDKAVVEAYRLEQVGRIDDAIEKWRSIANVTEGINNDLAAGAWFAVGYLHLDVGLEEEKFSIGGKPFDLKRYFQGFQKAYENEDDAKKAISAYDKVIRLKSDSALTYSNRGLTKFVLGKYNEALTDFDEAIRLDPDYTLFYVNRGLVKNSLGKHNEAIVDLI